MSLRHINFEQFKKTCLKRLIETGAPETKNIELNRDTYGKNYNARAEFLADVSSLTKTVGGDLIIGVETDNVALASGNHA